MWGTPKIIYNKNNYSIYGYSQGTWAIPAIVLRPHCKWKWKNPPLPVKQFISKHHAVPDINNFLMRVLYRILKASPKQIVVNHSWATIHSSNLAFNKMNTSVYIQEIFDGTMEKYCGSSLLHWHHAEVLHTHILVLQRLKKILNAVPEKARGIQLSGGFIMNVQFDV